MNDYLFVNEISNEQWLDIKKLAIQIHASGKHGSDQMKTSIEAFLLWLMQQETQLAYDATLVKRNQLN